MTSTSNPALFQAATSYQPADFRQLVRLVYPDAGVIGTDPTTALQVVPSSPTALSVRVQAGRAVVQDTRLTSPFDLYLAGTSSAYTTVTLATADPSNPRIDRIVLRSTNTEAGDASSATTIEAVTGTPAASPAAPATPNGAISLATVLVGTGVTVINSGDITDTRVYAVSDINTGGASPLIEGYNLYSWTHLDTTHDRYPMTGTQSNLSGRRAVRNTTSGTGNTQGVLGILRKGQDQAAVGSIVWDGAICFTNVAGTATHYFGIGLSDTFGATSWDEGVALFADATNGSVKFYTNTSTGVDLTAYSSGTQRGSTVSGLSANTWYPFRITISEAGNVKCEFNSSTVFDGAGGVDLLTTSAKSVAIGLASLTSVNQALLGPCTITYL